jgi:ABC-2 type transport system permease protein
MGNFLKLQPNLLEFILTGAIAAGVLQVAQLDVSYSLLYDIWSKSIKHTFLAPVSEYEYIIGSWLIGIARGIVVFVLLVIFSHWAFGFNLPSFERSLIFAVGIFLSALIIGMLVCWLVLLYGQRVEVTAWSLATMLMLVCGIYYPVNYLPKPFMIFAELIPLTYFLEYFRMAYGFKPVFSHVLIKGFGLSFIYSACFFVMLKAAFMKARRTGMILRLSE